MAEVLVTGGAGYIGSWWVLALLGAGHSVRTTVRDPAKEPELRAMLHAGGAADDAKVTVLRADLRADAGWRDALEGCDHVLHVARAAGVARVVLTSAFGAIGYGHPEASRVFTEADRTDVDGGIAPYQKSKTLAERAAWEFVADGGPELVAVNPVGVFGPVLGRDYSPLPGTGAAHARR